MIMSLRCMRKTWTSLTYDRSAVRTTHYTYTIHYTSCDPIRGFTHETKHSKLTELKGGQAFNIRHCHLPIKFRRPLRPIPTESINRIHTQPEGTNSPQTSAPVQQACFNDTWWTKKRLIGSTAIWWLHVLGFTMTLKYKRHAVQCPSNLMQ